MVQKHGRLSSRTGIADSTSRDISVKGNFDYVRKSKAWPFSLYLYDSASSHPQRDRLFGHDVEDILVLNAKPYDDRCFSSNSSRPSERVLN